MFDSSMGTGILLHGKGKPRFFLSCYRSKLQKTGFDGILLSAILYFNIYPIVFNSQIRVNRNVTLKYVTVTLRLTKIRVRHLSTLI
jgi:hypothetical protein